MKARFKQMWIEHQSKDKKPKDIIKDDTDAALGKMISILSKSQHPELVKEKEKLNLVRKKLCKELSKQHQKEQEIQTINEAIRKVKEPKTIFKLQGQLQKLKNPEPLEPLEMVDALLSLLNRSHYKVPSIKKVSERIDNLERIPKLHAEELIYVASELTATALITPIKYKIDVRKKFLEKTLGSLSIVTKLPNKPGDQENISGVVKNLQESFKGVFVHNQELYKNQIDLLAESLQLLLRIRGELKAWVDVDKFVKQYKIAGEQLILMVRNAKSPDGGGIFQFFGGEDLKNLVKLLDKLEFLTQDHRLFYKTIIEPSSTDNLILKLTKYKAVLDQQISMPDQVCHGYYINFLSILDSYFNKALSDIILKYFGIDNIIIRTNKYYKDQLYYTNTAIKWLTGIQSSKKNHIEDVHGRGYINVNSVIELLDKKEISYGKPRSRITNERYGYPGPTKDQTIKEKEYSDHLKEYPLKEKLSLLNQTQKILSFFEQIFLKVMFSICKKFYSF